MPQASKDLTLYQQRAHENAIYDKSAKRYVAGPNFTPVFMVPDPANYLARLQRVTDLAMGEGTWLANPPPLDIAITPQREVDASVLRAVLASLRGGNSLDIRYQSMSPLCPDAIWRRVTPHAFGHDGFRWHVRAWCHQDRKFKDFLLPRILEVGSTGPAGVSASEDKLWQESFDIVIAPHPKLSASQQAVVAKDYGMIDGRGILTVRHAMLFYVLRRLGLLEDALGRDPRSQHIVAVNAREVAEAMTKVKFEFDEVNNGSGAYVPPDHVDRVPARKT